MRILVAGAGIGGLTFARAVATTGWSVDIIERAERLEAVGAGIVLQPNGMAVLARIGLAQAVLTRGGIMRSMRHSRGIDILNLALADVWEGAAFPTVGIRRSALQEILLDSIRHDENVTLRSGVSLEGVDVESAMTVVRCSDGSSSRYDVVVGADGVFSRLRSALFPSHEARYTGLRWWRMISERPRSIGRDEWIATECDGGAFGVYPVGDGYVHSHVTFRGTTAPCERGNELDHLERVVRTWDSTIAEVLDRRCTPVHLGEPMMVRPPIWGSGRCVLIGDAAHAIAPTLSQGGSLAMEDAWALAQLLRAQPHSREIATDLEAVRTRTVDWALRMATAQVNSLLRPIGNTQLHVDRAVAMRYMQQMYAPLVKHSAELESLQVALQKDRF